MRVNYELENVPVNIIDLSWCNLRNTVNKDSADFQEFLASITNKGVLEPLVVRRIEDEDGNPMISLIDGFRRFTAAKLAGIEVVACKIYDNCSDKDALALQLELNIHRLKNTDREIYKQLTTIIEMEGSTMTIPRLAKLVNKSVQWVKERLKIESLSPDILDLVNRGIISGGNAVQLVKIWSQDRPEWIEKAQTLTVADFKSLVKAYLRQRTKENVDPKPWAPDLKFRSLPELRIELRDLKAIKAIVASMPNASPIELVREGLAYAVSMDKETLEERNNLHKRILIDQKVQKQIRCKKAKEQQLSNLEEKLQKLKEELKNEQRSGESGSE